MSTPTLIFHPSFAECAQTGVNRIVRKDGIYTCEMLDGTSISARLEHPNDADTMGTINAVKAGWKAALPVESF